MQELETSTRKWIVYTLHDPLVGAVRYVGVTHRPKVRLNEHTCHAYRDRNHRACWIRSLLKQGRRPVLVVVEEGTGDWQAAEKRWIQHYRDQGADLVNATDGGEGTLGYVPTAETKAKLSVAAKKNHTGRKRSKESRRHMSEAQQAYQAKVRAGEIVPPKRGPRSPETLARMAASQRGKKHTAESRAKMSAARQHVSPETREKLRQRTLARPVEQRQAFAQNQKGKPKSEDWKRKMSAAKKGKPRPKEVIDKMRAARHQGPMKEETKQKIRDTFAKKKLATQ